MVYAFLGDAEAVKKVVGSSTYLHDKTYSFKFYSKAEIPPFILP